MTEPIVLSGGILAESGAFYVLVVHEDAEDDETVICSGTREGGTISLRQLTDLEEIETMIALETPWREHADAAALTAEGEVIFLNPTNARVEIIPGAGYRNEGAKGIGRMSGFAQVRDRLVAMGFRGQVYVRAPETGWSDVSLPSTSRDGGPNTALFDAAEGPSRSSAVLVGIDIYKTRMTEEITAAKAAGDFKRYAALIRAETRPDIMSVRLYDGGWTNVDLGDEEGAIGAILREEAGTYLLVADTGTIFRTADFSVVEEVFRPDTSDGFDDIKLWQGEPLFLVGNTLMLFRANELIPFDPPLPAGNEFCLSVCPSQERIAAVFPDHVQLYENGSWTRLEPSMIDT